MKKDTVTAVSPELTMRPGIATNAPGASPVPTRANTYNGGKGRVYQQIINQIPPHQVYIEGCLGNGSVLRAKRAALRSFGVECDPHVIAAHWRGDELPGFTVVCGDVFEFLQAYPWSGGEFVYLDPPYLMETRSSQRSLYRHEIATPDEHHRLLTIVKQLPCPVAISGYWSALYGCMLGDWRTISFQTTKRSGKPATEWLWMNYPEPLELHDYRYLGDTYRSRERIKRKRERWKERLRQLPSLERHALFAAIEEVRLERTAGDTAASDDRRRRIPPQVAMLANTAKTGDDGRPRQI